MRSRAASTRSSTIPNMTVSASRRFAFNSLSGLGHPGTGTRSRSTARTSPRSPWSALFHWILPWNETFDIGADTGTPVDDRDYQVPFAFTGKIDKLTIALDGAEVERGGRRQEADGGRARGAGRQLSRGSKLRFAGLRPFRENGRARNAACRRKSPSQGLSQRRGSLSNRGCVGVGRRQSTGRTGSRGSFRRSSLRTAGKERR